MSNKGFDLGFSRSKSAFITYTAFYFGIEIFINLLIFKQLSVQSDFFTIEAMEFWGKVITAVGAALLITKMQIAGFQPKSWIDFNSHHPVAATIVFIGWILVLIPVSFVAQNVLINKLVEDSTDEQRNHAILVVAAHGALKPYFHPNLENKDETPTGFQKFSSLFLDRKDAFHTSYTNDEQLFVLAAKGCNANSELILDAKTKLEKAFFAYNAYKEPSKEPLYQQAITDYYKCLLDDKSYADRNVSAPAFDDSKFQEFYSEYTKGSVEYEDHASWMRRATRSRSWKNKYQEGLDAEWSKGTRKLLGFKSDIPPNLPYNDFVRHPDIKKYFLKKTKGKYKDTYPFDEGFDEEAKLKFIETIKDFLPNTAIPTYTNIGEMEPLGKQIDYGKSYAGDKIEVSDTDIEESGKRAYKAIIMPMVALGTSLSFLIINVLASLAFIVRLLVRRATGQDPKGLTALVLLTAIIAVVVIPDKQLDPNLEITNRNTFMKVIYYYESHVTKVFDVIKKP